MKAYLMDGYIVCTDTPIEGAILEWELSSLQAELINAGGTVEYNAGTLTIKPAPPVVEETQSVGLTKLEFMQRFTDAELDALYTVAKTNVAVEIWLAKFNATTPDAQGYSVYLNDQRTIDSVNMLEAAGLLAAGRAAEILS
jgi:hypothetical protein